VRSKLAAAAVATVAIGLAGATTHAPAREAPAPDRVAVVLVANAEGGTVSVVDARRLKVIREIDVLPDGPGASPAEDDPFQALLGQMLIEAAGGLNYAQDLDLSPDGRTLYVSRGHRGDVAAFRIRTGGLIWKSPVDGLRADHMTLSHDGRRLYVSDMTANAVHILRARTGERLGSFPTGEWPHDNHLAQNDTLLYNASLGNILVPDDVRAVRPESYRLTVVDARSLQTLRTYDFPAGIRPFVLDEERHRLWAQLSEFHGVAEFDLNTGVITKRLRLPVDKGVTEDDYDFEAPHHGLDLSGDGRTLCAAGRASDYVALVSTRRLRRRAIIEVGDAPGWATTGPGGNRCFVPNNREGTLSVISYRRGKEIARIKVGAGPKQIEAGWIPASLLGG
jgi:DNA-binding beta-propeller fold protein YncE